MMLNSPCVAGTFAVKYNPNHQWYYLSNQTPEEVILIKCYDSLEDRDTLEPMESDWDPARAFFEERKVREPDVGTTSSWQGWSDELEGSHSDSAPTIHLPHIGISRSLVLLLCRGRSFFLCFRSSLRAATWHEASGREESRLHL